MMRMCLVSPLSVSDFVDPELTLGTYRRKMAPQLGILCLAAELLETGIDVEIVNLDECFFDFVESEQQKAGLRTDGASRPCRAAASTCGESSSAAGLSGFASPDAFFADLVRRFEAAEFDAYGFGSICSSYPLTLRLAEEVKRLVRLRRSSSAVPRLRSSTDRPSAPSPSSTMSSAGRQTSLYPA
jgi:hypothetical protein